MNEAVDLSLIIPIFNGGCFLEDTLDRLARWVQTQSKSIELFFVNDGSIDDTERILSNFKARQVIRCMLITLPTNRGKGFAIRSALKYTHGHFVAFTDADLPYGLDALAQMMESMNQDANIYLLYGSRAHHGSGALKGYGFIRKIGRWFFSFITRFFLTADVADANCGIKMFHSQLAELAATTAHTDRFAFDMELFAIARANGWRYADFPVQLSHRKESSVRLVTDTLLMLRDMMRISRNLREGIYVRH